MGIKNTGTVNDAATPGTRGKAIKRDPLDNRPVNPNATSGTRGESIVRDPWNNGPVNPSATIGVGRGYVPARVGVHATPERRKNNKTEVEITVTPDPVTGGGLIQGNFYTLNTDEDGNIFLQGGCVIAGANGETVEPFKLMNLPANGVPNWEGDPEDHAIMTIRGNALTSDGVLLPQFNLESAVISINDEIGQTTLPTKANPSGVYRTSLGQFTEGGFVSNRPGNFLITFCSGSYDVNREG